MDSKEGDLVLWKAFKTGDEKAFALMYRHFAKPLYRYGLKITKDTTAVEDAIQDLFVDIWNSRQNLTDPDSVMYYLFRILRRKISRGLAIPQQSEPLEEYVFEQLLSTEAIDSEIVKLESSEIKQKKIQKAMDSLSDRQKEVVNLRYFHDFSPQQIAGIMGITLQSVHNLLQKSMKNLRAALDHPLEFLLSLLVPFGGLMEAHWCPAAAL